MPILTKLREFLEASKVPYSVHSHPEAYTAQESEFRDLFPGCEVGAMPPFGNLYGLPVYVDRVLEKDDEIVFNGGTHTLTVKMAFRDFVTLVKSTMVEFSVHL